MGNFCKKLIYKALIIKVIVIKFNIINYSKKPFSFEYINIRIAIVTFIE